MSKRKSHPGSIETRGNSRRLILRIDGERHVFKITPGATEAQAEQFARDKHEELQGLATRRALGLPGELPLEDLLVRYEEEKLPLLSSSSIASYGMTLRLFRAFLADRKLELAAHQFGSPHVRDFLTYARAKPLSGRAPASNRSVERHRAVLSAVFSFASELELVEYNPVRKVRPPKVDGRDPVILSAEQYEALIAAAEERPFLRLYILVLGETGMRSGSEALWLTWEDLDLRGGFVRVVSGRHDHRTKSGEGRWVPMTPRLREALQEHAATYRMATYPGGRTRWVFHHPFKRRHAKAGERLTSLRRAFDNAAKRAGLPAELVQHDLRHRRVTTWLAEGKNPVHVKEAVGHSDLRVTMAYTHLSREHLRSLVEGGDQAAGGKVRGSGTDP